MKTLTLGAPPSPGGIEKQTVRSTRASNLRLRLLGTLPHEDGGAPGTALR